VNFSPTSAELVAPDKTVFDIQKSGKLYYLNNVTIVILVKAEVLKSGI